MARWFSTLQSQMMAGLLALILLFGVASLYSLKTLEVEREDDLLLRLGGELRLVVRQLSMQAMNYKENAPRDYPTYYRDLRLYYRDLMSKSERLEAVSTAFDEGRFPPALTGMSAPLDAALDSATRSMAERLAATWEQFRADLEHQLGSDPEEPRLEWAAEHIIAAAPELEARIDALWQALQAGAAQRQRAADRLHRGVLTLAALLAAGILAWFYLRILRPLGTTVQGVRRIAAGDFRYQVPVSGRDEIAWLGAEFNRLAGRLNTLFDLLARLQQGSDLEETLRQVSQTLPALLPLDWVGIVFVDPDGHARLEAARRDGEPEPVYLQRFPVQDTLLEASLREHRPQHIHDLQGLAASDRRYRLIRLLNDIGMRDAIFMPIRENSPLPGVLVFAARRANAFTPEHVELMSNFALLITLSFGKTLRLAERGRLAAIGQFASGIVHEIRNPLATIMLAFDYLSSTELPERAAKRVRLASGEAARLAALLDDILLFAKPIRLEVEKTPLLGLVRQVFGESGDPLQRKKLTVSWPDASRDLLVDVDPDRMRQVVLNLLTNAIDASPESGSITVSLTSDADRRTAHLSLCNGGETLTPADKERAFEPFFSTKRHGTGLGLGIVRRLVEAHGGHVDLTPCGEQTCAEVVLPLAAPD